MPRTHDTPPKVAWALSRLAPRRIETLLEPSAGVGALLGPYQDRLGRNGRLTCVEQDARAARRLGQAVREMGSKPRVIVGDFLSARIQTALTVFEPEGFACVCMNPPFYSRGYPSALITSPSLGFNVGVPLPLEAHFVVRALELLRPGGRLVTILPASVMVGHTAEPLRAAMMKTGSFRIVHELPPETFPGIEAAIFLVSYDRDRRGRTIKLLNHRLVKPDQIEIKAAGVVEGERLDYGYHETRGVHAAIVSAWPLLGWARLGDHASIIRGRMRGGEGFKGVVHSSHTDGGVWRLPPRPWQRPAIDVGGVRRSDILMARVHRSAAETAGMLLTNAEIALTDCVYRVRPGSADDATQLLFALRIILTQPEFVPLVVRGSGAKYVSRDDLESLQVPLALSSTFRAEYRRWLTALTARDSVGMRVLETSVQHSMFAEFISGRDGVAGRR